MRVLHSINMYCILLYRQPCDSDPLYEMKNAAWMHSHSVIFPFPSSLSGSGPSGPSSGVASPAHIPIHSHSVPDFSYSSSEDEFYDADEFYQSSTSPKHCIE